MLSEAYGAVVGSLVVVIGGLVHQIARLEAELAEGFERHQDAEILRSLPGLGVVLGARVLAEFGDDPTRYADPKARKNYAGTSPITRASGKRLVVLARVARNRRLADACYLWAFASLNASPGARRDYDTRRMDGPLTRPSGHSQTAWLGFSMAAYSIASLTGKRWPGLRGSKSWLDSFRLWDV